MKTTKYHQYNGEVVEIEYNENAPCIICGEPVLSASMGGTAICPSCDCGKCRYCGKPFFCINPKLDGGMSKQTLINHIKGCRELHPDLNKRLKEFYDKLEKDNEKLSKELKQIIHLRGDKQQANEFTKCGINIDLFEFTIASDKKKVTCKNCQSNKSFFDLK